MTTGRLKREYGTIRAMIALYCRDHHRPGRGLCADCGALERYAEQRILKCPFGEDKPTCARCLVHCYRADAREQVRQVMRYAGPRMILAHPVQTFRHYWDEWTRRPLHIRKGRAAPASDAGPAGADRP